MLKKPLRLAAALTAVALVAAACSSGSSSSSTTAAPKFTGAPVTIGQIVPITGAAITLPQTATGLTAAVAYYNAHGGINGHEIKLIQCDTKDDANTEVACAQQMVAAHAVATVADDTNFNTAGVQAALDAAGIPRIGLLSGSTTEYADPLDYDLTTGSILLLGGMVVQLINHGCKTVSMLTVDSPQAAQLPALIKPFATAAGGTVANFIYVPGTATDYTQYLTQAEANGACGAAFALGTTQADALAAVANQVKPNLSYSAASGTYATSDLKKLGAWAKTSRYVYSTPFMDDPAVPGAKNVINVLQGGGATSLTATTTNGQGVVPVLALKSLLVAAKSITGDITAASVVSAMNSVQNINLWGVIPNWTPSAKVSGGPVFGAIFKNVSNPYLWDEAFNGNNGTSSGKINIMHYLPGNSAVPAT